MDDRLPPGTDGDDYTDRLQTRGGVWWKRLLNVQAPYRWNLRRQQLGRTLDVGCGLGRNLTALPAGSVGVDHNAASIAVAREAGLEAYTVDEFLALPASTVGVFEALCVAHVVEHMTEADALALLRTYLPFLEPGGAVFFICPQERGYSTDATHVRFVDGDALESLARQVGLEPDPWFSFPFPRQVGRHFAYNEFCLLARKPR